MTAVCLFLNIIGKGICLCFEAVEIVTKVHIFEFAVVGYLVKHRNFTPAALFEIILGVVVIGALHLLAVLVKGQPVQNHGVLPNT